MKNSISKTHLSIATLALTLCGAATAAVTPLGLPWQATVSPKVQQHEAIVASAGHYEGTLTMHIPGMADPMETPCTEVVEAIGDLWTTARFETTFEGLAFSGASTFGYDTTKQKYVGTWIDSTNTAITQMEGDFDEAKGAIVMNYESLDPASGELKPMRSETVFGKSGYRATFYNIEGESASLQMEIVMKRKPKAMEAGSGQ